MSVKVFVTAKGVTVGMEKPVIFPESPALGDIVDVRSMLKFQTDERNTFNQDIKLLGLRGHGKVVERHWSSEVGGGEPSLFIDIELEKE